MLAVGSWQSASWARSDWPVSRSTTAIDHVIVWPPTELGWVGSDRRLMPLSIAQEADSLT